MAYNVDYTVRDILKQEECVAETRECVNLSLQAYIYSLRYSN